MVRPVIELDIPGFGQLRLEHAVFDVNGTLAVDGQPMPEIRSRLQELKLHLHIHLLSALSHGNQVTLEDAFSFPIFHIEPGGEAQKKADYLRRLGAEACVAIGNGRNDVLMLEAAALGIAVIEREGGAVQALQAADVVVDTRTALDLLLNPRRLLATLRS